MQQKLEKLKEILKSYKRVVIAFSGGVDSTLLLRVAKDVLGTNVIAATAVSNVYPSFELDEANEFATNLGVEYIKIPCNQLGDVEGFKENPEDRCYICKRAVFSKLMETAESLGSCYVLDGTNADDIKDYRPGLRAIKELGVKSPLLEAGLTKLEIRELSKQYGLKTASKPSFACLATRIPYNEEITPEKLLMIDKSEKYLLDSGLKNIRVRCHGNLARLEINKNEFGKFLDSDFMNEVDRKLKEFGFKYVSLDLGGYKTGSMNLEVGNEQR